jgi:hypothetical protein
MVTISPLLAALVVQAVSPSIDLRVLANLTEREGLAERLLPLDPDLVVIGIERGEGDAVGAGLLQPLPRAKIVLISSDGRMAVIHEMRPHRTVLLDFSPDNFRRAVLGVIDTKSD